MPSDYTKPVYRIDGKEFKTVTGLCTYLLKKHASMRAASVSGVRQSDHTLRVYCHGAIGRIEVACYKVSVPEIGKPMSLERC